VAQLPPRTSSFVVFRQHPADIDRRVWHWSSGLRSLQQDVERQGEQHEGAPRQQKVPVEVGWFVNKRGGESPSGAVRGSKKSSGHHLPADRGHRCPIAALGIVLPAWGS
jgi:hypothetical protein